MADIKEVLDWADSLCKHALTEARNGDTSVVNRICSNTAMKVYFDNVHGIGAVKSHDFPFHFASRFKEINGLYEDYQGELAKEEAIGKVATLESKLDNLAAMVQQLVEAQQKPVVEEAVESVVTEEVEAAPAKKNGKKPAKTEVVETEVIADEAVESEAETPAEEDESEA